MAVRSGEEGFYLCQTQQNVYKSSQKIKIRWLDEQNKGKSNDAGRFYSFDFYDVTDFDCVLTTVELEKVEKTYKLSKDEQSRIESILKKSLDVEKGVAPRPTVTEENPDGCECFKALWNDQFKLTYFILSGPFALQRRGSVGQDAA